MTNTEQKRKIFWNMYEEELKKQGYPFRIAHRDQYATVNKRSPNSDYCISMDFLAQKRFLRVGLYIRDNIPAFEYMYARKAQIEEKLGFKPIWTLEGEKNPNTRRIEIRMGFDPDNFSDFQRMISQSISYIKAFIEVLPNYSIYELFDF